MLNACPSRYLGQETIGQHFRNRKLGNLGKSDTRDFTSDSDSSGHTKSKGVTPSTRPD